MKRQERTEEVLMRETVWDLNTGLSERQKLSIQVSSGSGDWVAGGRSH